MYTEDGLVDGVEGETAGGEAEDFSQPRMHPPG